MIVDKPGGKEHIWARLPDNYVGKILYVNAGESLSKQYHETKHETLLFMSGEARFQINDAVFDIVLGRSVVIEPGTVHRLTAITDCVIFEVSTDHLDDVVRIDDLYGRT